MPRHIRLLSRYANIAAITVFSFMFLYAAFADVSAGLALFFGAVGGLLAFDLHVIEKSARLLSEEEWLKAEIRKEELRRHLAGLRIGAGGPPVPAEPRRLDPPDPSR